MRAGDRSPPLISARTATPPSHTRGTGVRGWGAGWCAPGAPRPESAFPWEGALLGPGPLGSVQNQGSPGWRVGRRERGDLRKVRKWGSLGQRGIPGAPGAGGTVTAHSADWQPFAVRSQAALRSRRALGGGARTDPGDPPPDPGTPGAPAAGTGRAEPPHLPPTRRPPAGAARLPGGAPGVHFLRFPCTHAPSWRPRITSRRRRRPQSRPPPSGGGDDSGFCKVSPGEQPCTWGCVP